MKQVFFNNLGKIVVEDVPAPMIKDDGILVRVKYSLISSGTESSIAKNSNILRKIANKPELIKEGINRIVTRGIRSTLNKVQSDVINRLVPIGYSAAGIVIEKGKNVKDIDIGDQVACAGAGYANHAEIIYVPRNLAVKLPQNIKLNEAAFTTLGAIAMQGVRRARVEFGENTVVIGLGLIGQLACQMLKIAGCRVTGMDLITERVDLAKRMGLLTAEEAMSNGVGADAVIICASTHSSELVNQAFNMCRKKGRVVVVGAVGMELEREEFYKKELDLLISTSYGPGRYDKEYEEKGKDYPLGYVRWTENRNMEEFVNMISEHKIDVRSLITSECSIENAKEAYGLLSQDPKNTLAILLKYSSDDEVVHSRKVILPTIMEGGKEVVNIALIGGGGFAKSVHLPNLKKIPNVCIRAIVTARGANAKQLAKQYGAAYCTTDYKEVLNDKEVDAVLISTRHDLHKLMAIDAAKAGKHIFIEKPLGLTVKECEQINEIVEKNGVLLSVGFNRRCSPLSIEAKRLADKKNSPKIVIYRVNAGPLPADSWVLDPKEGGGRIIGEGCHFFDFLYWFIGKEKVRLQAEKISKDPNSVVVTIKFADGSVGILIYSSIGNSSYPKERVEIFADGAIAVIDDFKQLVLRGFNQKDVKLRRADKGHFSLLSNFVKAVKGEEKLLITGEDGLRATSWACQTLGVL